MERKFKIAFFAIVLIGFFTILPVNAEELKPEEKDGESVYKKMGCKACHGTFRGGTGKGPSLTSVAFHWDEKTLTTYLKDPVAAREKDERLQKLSERYAPVRMLQYDFKEEELSALVKYLLENSKRPVSKPKEE